MLYSNIITETQILQGGKAAIPEPTPQDNTVATLRLVTKGLRRALTASSASQDLSEVLCQDLLLSLPGALLTTAPMKTTKLVNTNK